MTSRSFRRPPDKLKWTIRNLPPGLTKTEFLTALGQEWHDCNGRVDWIDYGPGKLPKTSAKYTKPSRASLHFVNASYQSQFRENFNQITFADAKNSQNDSNFPPPVFELAINQKLPSSRKRVDPRMGTIDQDPDYQNFLLALTNPIPKSSLNVDELLSNTKNNDSAIKTTPLIEGIRAKKAARAAKDVKLAQIAKEAKELRDAAKIRRRKGKVTTPLPTVLDKQKRMKPDRNSRQSVKVLARIPNSESPTHANKSIIIPSASNAASSTTTVNTTAPTAPRTQYDRRKTPAAVLNIAAKIQKDLGLVTPASQRLGRQGSEVPSSSALNAIPTTEASRGGGSIRNRDRNRPAKYTNVASPAPTKPLIQPTILKKPTRPTTEVQKPTSPQSVLATPANAPAWSTQSPQKPILQTSSSSTSLPPPAFTKNSRDSLRVFLKHANGSQGITEPILHLALEAAFGTVVAVDIDKRKGTASADFATLEATNAAVSAGSLPVEGGVVEILRFIPRGISSTAGSAGGGGGNRGGSGRPAKGRAGASRGGRGGAPFAGGPGITHYTTPRARSNTISNAVVNTNTGAGAQTAE